LTLTKPQNLTTPINPPALVSPSSATFTVIDTDPILWSINATSASATWYNEPGWGNFKVDGADPRGSVSGAPGLSFEIVSEATALADDGVSAYSGNKLFRNRFYNGVHGGGRASIFFSSIPGNSVEPGRGVPVWTRYRVCFGSRWTNTNPGKMPGLVNYDGACGFGGDACDWREISSPKNNGWSARGGWSGNGCPPENRIRPTIYLYDGLMKFEGRGFGQNILWTGYNTCDNGLQKNVWYTIEHMIQLNTNTTPFEDGGPTNDGKIHVWVDGVQVLNLNNEFFIGSVEEPVEAWFLDWYHGGGTPAPQDMAAYTDDYAISLTGRVGIS
jgi:hypothetical protein